MINLAFDFAIGIMTCFLNGPLVITLILGFFCLLLLFLALIIFPTSSADKAENASLICNTSSILGDMLAFGAFLLLELTLLSGERIANNDGITDVDGTILGTEVSEVDLEDLSELEVFDLEVK